MKLVDILYDIKLKEKYSMGKKIGIVIVAILVMCIGLLVSFNVSIAKESIQTLTETTIEDNLKIYKTLLDSKMEQQLVRVERLAKDHMIGSLFEDDHGHEHSQFEEKSEANTYEIITENLISEKELEEMIDNISIINNKGIIVASANESALGMDVSERTYFQKVMETGEKYIGESVISKDTGEAVVPVCAPVLNIKGEVQGIVSATIATRLVAAELDGKTILNTKETYPILFERKGTILAHRDANLIGQVHNDEKLVDLIINDPIEEDTNHIEKTEYMSMTSNDLRELAFIRLDNVDWVLAITTDETEFLKPIKAMRGQSILIGIVALLITVIITLFISKWISKSLGEITNIIRQIASLNLKGIEITPIMLKTRDEIGLMANATSVTKDKLSEMVELLIKYADELAMSADKMSNLASEVVEDTGKVSEVMEELSASMEEINASTEEVSSTVDSINENIKAITDSIETSGKVALNMAAKAQDLKADTQQESEYILASYTDVKMNMQDSIKRGEVIAKVQILVDSIKSITEQTNLLALNASIEAARAGELGKGFGVVAREIGTLAQQSGDAVSEIEAVIAEVLAATTDMKRNAEVSLEFMEKQIHGNLKTIENTAETYMEDSKQVYDILKALEENAEILKNYSENITVAVSEVAEAIAENTSGIVNIVNRTAGIQEKVTVMEDVIEGNRKISKEFSDLTGEFTI